MSKHTPGPWMAREVTGSGFPGQSGWAIDFNEDQEQVVDYVYEAADAHLIAAAPDLLEVLESARDELVAMKSEIGFRGMTLDVIGACEAAIARARGEA